MNCQIAKPLVLMFTLLLVTKVLFCLEMVSTKKTIEVEEIKAVPNPIKEYFESAVLLKFVFIS